MNSGFLQSIVIVVNAIIKAKTNITPDFSTAFIPMRVAKYLDDPMIQNNGGTIGFFLFISTIMPVLRMINKVTSEKETKVREVMSIMGLSDTPYWFSWITMYVLIYLLISVLCTIITLPMFKYSDKGIVFLMFLLYGTSCISFSLFVSSFFSRAKTAILVGVALFLVSYFSLFTVNQATTESTKSALSIFPTAAMALGFFTLLGFEGIQTGIHWDNINS
jgi:ATP-binding cassette subfamily A (ABC1) protein 3